MASIYQDRIDAMGRHWHRPWLCLLACVFGAWFITWLYHEDDVPQLLCDQIEGSRFHAAVEMDGLVWTGDLESGLRCAREHERRVFVAFHAMYDTNARYNESHGFTQPRVKKTLKRYVLVMLHIDRVRADFLRIPPTDKESRKLAKANMDLLEGRFGTFQEPLYAVLQPTEEDGFRIVGVYDLGGIHDSDRFEDFLKYPHVQPSNGWWRTGIDKLKRLLSRP
jgi:hypothetical protein